MENYVEPFFGSGAVLLARPGRRKGPETVNDLNGHLVNAWRAIVADPDLVAFYADNPISELDLHARHLFLVNAQSLVEELIADPEWHDAKLAGWWIWGASSWLGSGWCSGNGPWRLVDGRVIRVDAADRAPDAPGITRALPHMGGGQGVSRALPHMGGPRGVTRKLPILRGDGSGGVTRKLPTIARPRGVVRDNMADEAAPVDPDAADDDARSLVDNPGLRQFLQRLSERLRRVRMVCGDWTRVLGPSITTKQGLTAMVLDPPYTKENRMDGVYTHDTDVAAAVRAWAFANGDNPLYRIALCGYEDGVPAPPGWETFRWKANGGYANQGDNQARLNARRETIWFSPHCVKPDERPSIFDLFAAASGDS